MNVTGPLLLIAIILIVGFGGIWTGIDSINKTLKVLVDKQTVSTQH